MSGSYNNLLLNEIAMKIYGENLKLEAETRK